MTAALSLILVGGLALAAVLRWPRGDAARVRRGERFARDARAWVAPADTPEVDNVLEAGERAVAWVAGVTAFATAGAWALVGSDAVPSVVIAGYAATWMIPVGLRLRALATVPACSGRSGRLPVADFLGPATRVALAAAPVVVACLAVSATNRETASVAVFVAVIWAVAWWQRRRILGLELAPRDRGHAYTLDALRAHIVVEGVRGVGWLAWLPVMVWPPAEDGPFWAMLLVLGVGTVLLVLGAADDSSLSRRGPRFRFRRWPELGPGQYALADPL